MKMNETPIDQKARASNSGQSRSQPSHLCQACLSVLVRDDLELTKLYPHHNDLKDFIEATQLRCYICSWVFAALRKENQESLRLLAEGEKSDYVVTQEAQMTDGVVSDPRAELRNIIGDGITAMEVEWDKGVSWVSFTGMGIRPGLQNHTEIWVLLNPLYEEYFPFSTSVCDSWLKELWMTVEDSMRFQEPLVITTRQNYLELGLMTAELPANTGSMGTWTTIAGWVQQCFEWHRCLSHIDLGWHPTRLVEIISNDSFRIIRSDSKYFQSKHRYVTLSHRWGNSADFVQLTTSNLADFEIGCPVTALRKTFQDAMQIARRLEIPYIWVDSLCIIQSGDDGADWRKESAEMAQVYSNSFCNISADWGDEHNGLFFDRTGSFEPPYELHMRWKIPRSLPVANVLGLPPEGGLCHIMRPVGWSDNVMESPLNRRGWVLQERQLAPRILHFSPDQVSWECGAKIAWERTPLGFSDSNYAWSCGLTDCTHAMSEMRRLRLRNPEEPVDWPRLVEDYTRCELTKHSDRLVAVAGIAKVLVSKVKDQYVAGIWSKTLPEALVWYKREKSSCNPTKSYFTPSFSWAAAEGSVSSNLATQDDTLPPQRILDSTSATFVQHREKPISAIVGSTVRAELFGQLLANDVFGPITSPEVEVRMQGILRSCRRLPLHLVPERYMVLGGDSHVFPSVDIESSATSPCFEEGTVCSVRYDRADDEDAQLDRTMYYYTIILYDPAQDHEPGASFSYEGVQGVFLKSVDPSMGRFERIGHLSHWEQDGVQFGNVLLPLGNERNLPAWSYDETSGRHTFYIV